MRRALISAVLVSALAAPLATLPAHADTPPPVGSITVTSGIQEPAHRYGGFLTVASVSWTGEDASVDGVQVCLVQGTTATDDPTYCAEQENVPAPGTHTARITLRPGKAYVFSVYTYVDDPSTGGRTYSSAVREKWHGSALDIKARPLYATFGDTITLTAKLTDTRTDAPIPRQEVTLLKWRPDTGTWRRLDTFRTDDDGNVKVRLKPRREFIYAWSYAGNDGHLGVAEGMTYYLDYLVTAHLSKSSAAPGERVRMYGIVRPRTVGKRVLLLQYQSSPCNAFVKTGESVVAKRQTLPNGRTTFGYVITVSRSTAGTSRFEAMTNKDDRLHGGISDPVSLTVGSTAAATATRGSSRAALAVPTC